MTNRILDLSNCEGKIHLENSLLVLDNDEFEVFSIPLTDLAVVIMDNPRLSITKLAISALAEHSVPLIMTDRKHLPSGMLFPLVGNTQQTEYFTAQAKVKEPVKKKAWQELIRAKIKAQAEVLEIVTGSDMGLCKIAKTVLSGDSDNREGYAARRYWSYLKIVSKRDRDAEDANMYLNYGYAILHAMATRAVCGAGLHPSLGIQHHHRNNPFCLASDIMEPLRPIVDYAVWKIVNKNHSEFTLTKEYKHKLLSAMISKLLVNGEWITTFQTLAGITVALRKRFTGRKSTKLPLPKRILNFDSQ